MTSTEIKVMPRSRTFMSSPCNSAWSETKPLSRSYVSCDASLLRASPPPDTAEEQVMGHRALHADPHLVAVLQDRDTNVVQREHLRL
jgi:hypothetical protein